MKLDSSSLLLYGVTDRFWLNGHRLIDKVELAIEGGATCIQLREKNLGDVEFLAEALEIQALCRERGVLFIINDNIEIAKKISADGIHVGQEDLCADQVRALLGSEIILGVSVQTLEQAVLAETQGADYLGVGAVFPTDSKSDALDVSFETLTQICQTVNIPVIAIGGIGLHNVEQLSGSGIVGVAVISSIFGQEDMEGATRLLREKVEGMMNDNGMHI